MLAADRSLLEVNLRQSAIKLREKELNLYTDNFSAMATQAAVLAGFTTTCLIEINLPEDANPYAKSFLHLAGIFSICSNITCVSLSTITNIWGSGKALRGKDGSMDEAVEGINDERGLIFQTFACGLAGNLCTVLGACVLIMDFPVSLLGSAIVLYTAWMVYRNALRIQKKFFLAEAVRLDDLTKYPQTAAAGTSSPTETSNLLPSTENLSGKLNHTRVRKNILEIV